MKSVLPPKPSRPTTSVRRSQRTPRRQSAVDDIQTNPLFLQNLFAANVRLVRVARGLSQEELADRASLDRTYISSIERRLRNLSIQNMQRLALALDVDPRDLLNPKLTDDSRYRS